MNKTIIVAGALLAAALFPFAALAQGGAAAGATTGAIGGAIVGGPVGLVVGAVGGAIVGGISDDTRPRFREYVVRENRPSYTYREDPRIGIELPDEGINYYEVPKDYGQTEYRYTVVNGRTVLVDPRTRRIVQIIE
jgi:hypothetical protein